MRGLGILPDEYPLTFNVDFYMSTPLPRILLEYEAMPIVEMPSDEGNSVSVDHVIPAPTKANKYTKSYYR